MGGGEIESETSRFRMMKEKEQFMAQQVLLNSSFLSKVRKDAVIMYERRRD